jgi:hypothetical protein
LALLEKHKGLVLARQALDHFIHSFNLFYSSYFSGSLTHFAGDGHISPTSASSIAWILDIHPYSRLSLFYPDWPGTQILSIFHFQVG